MLDDDKGAKRESVKRVRRSGERGQKKWKVAKKSSDGEGWLRAHKERKAKENPSRCWEAQETIRERGNR